MHVVFSPVTDDELSRLSDRNPGWRVERDDDGATIVSPTFTDGGAQSCEAARQLGNYAKAGAGGRAFDANTGFTMSTGAVRAPDASWASDERIAATPAEQRTKYWRMCPDVVIEVASETDFWPHVCAKIDMYVREGARYAVALEPRKREAYVRGAAPAGLTLDLDAIFSA